MVLLVGAALFVRSLTTVLAQDAGFDRDHVLVVATNPSVAGYSDIASHPTTTKLVQRVTGVPGVGSASLTLMPPISNEDGNWTQSIAVDGGPMEEESTRYVYFNVVAAGYSTRSDCGCFAAVTSAPPTPPSPVASSSSTSRWRGASSLVSIRSAA